MSVPTSRVTEPGTVTSVSPAPGDGAELLRGMRRRGVNEKRVEVFDGRLLIFGRAANQRVLGVVRGLPIVQRRSGAEQVARSARAGHALGIGVGPVGRVDLGRGVRQDERQDPFEVGRPRRGSTAVVCVRNSIGRSPLSFW